MTAYGAVMNNGRYVRPDKASVRGDYFCPSCFERMMLVFNGANAYFRHKSTEKCPTQQGHPRESRPHLHAKHYLKHLIEAYGVDVGGVYIPAVNQDATRSVVLEKRVNTAKSYIILDIAVVDLYGDVLYAFEVATSHRTDMSTRCGFPAWEIDHDVILAIAQPRGIVSLKS